MIYYTKAFINNGYLYFTFISLAFARKLRLLHILITPKDLK